MKSPLDKLVEALLNYLSPEKHNARVAETVQYLRDAVASGKIILPKVTVEKCENCTRLQSELLVARQLNGKAAIRILKNLATPISEEERQRIYEADRPKLEEFLRELRAKENKCE